jgi:tRNA U34 5-methylaminomethyl-2-thiouridine-forming methyltransferase MnmC
MEYELRRSADGSYTLYSKTFDECYHSLKDGALKESLQKHILPAFSLVKKPRLRILDICFGLGFNTLATIYHIQTLPQIERVEIFSPEFDAALLQRLADFPYPSELAPFVHIIRRAVEKGVYDDGRVRLELFVGDAREYVRGLRDIDIVYQDPFSPKKNPALWTVEYFEDIHRLLKKDGALTTYSVATPVRLALDEAGFLVYEMPKGSVRPGTVAAKGPLPLKRVDMEAKRRRATSGPLRDVPLK